MTEYLGTVLDLFSGAGGMSYGFFAHPEFDVVGAADIEVGKPSTGHGALGCNATYEANIKVAPLAVDLSFVRPEELAERLGFASKDGPRVLLACPPCTGFSQALPKNRTHDDPRNSLVSRVAAFVDRFKPEVIIMENVPQLLKGRFIHHYHSLRAGLERLGYRVLASSYVLTRFGLPQQRERALIVAVRGKLPLYSLENLWFGYDVSREAVTVRRAIEHLPAVGSGATHPDDPAHTSPHLTELSVRRLSAIPADGGGWTDLIDGSSHLLIPSMSQAVKRGRLNGYPDVYGRMSWDKPAPTIKRECSHVGNGRYSHPVQNRQCTVREMGLLQGFPATYEFRGSRKNLYRQIGDAVPPLLSYQLAWLTHWILTGERPEIEQLVLNETSLRASDVVAQADRLATGY